METASTHSLNEGKEQSAVMRGLIAFLPGLALFILSGPGFGLDADAWRIVLSGYKLSHSGVWEASRLPGNPLPELLAAFCSWPVFYPYIEQLLPCIFFLFLSGTIYIVLTAVQEAGRNEKFYLLCISLLFWGTPVILINTATSMDYAPGLFFFILAFYRSGKRYSLWVPVLAGFAIATRVQYVLPLPALLYFPYKNNKENFTPILIKSLIVCSGVAAVFYAHFIMKYGLEMFLFVKPPYPPITDVIGRASIKTFGIAGSVSVVLLALYLLIRKNKISTNNQSGAFLIAITATVVFYLIYPYEAGYLMPAVVLLVWLGALWGTQQQMLFFVVTVWLSSLVFDISNRQFTVQGPYLNSITQRRTEKVLLTKSIEQLQKENRELIIFCEAMLPKIEVTAFMAGKSIPGNVKLLYGTEEEKQGIAKDGKTPILFEEYIKTRGIIQQRW